MQTSIFVRLFVPLLFSIVASVGGIGQTWSRLDGTSLYVHRIKVFTSPAILVACGDLAPPLNEMQNASMEFYSGEGFRTSTDGGVTWSERRLDGFSVRDIIRLPRQPQYWIASVVKPFTNTGGIVRSTDGGITWSSVPENDALRVEQFLSRDYAPPLILSAQVNTTSGFQISRDSAQSFTAPSNEPVQSRSIAISEADTSLVFMAGDGRGLPGVFVTRDNGETWTRDSLGLGGKRILCVAPSRHFSNVVYCGADSVNGQDSYGAGVFKSLDTGKTWFRLPGTQGLRVWSIVEHPLWGDVLIAAADSAGVIVTGSWGDGWEPRNDGLPSDRIVRTIELTEGPHPRGTIAAYVGTYGNGVYRSREITTSIDVVAARGSLEVQPQPMVGTGYIRVPFQTNEFAEIIDVNGVLVMQIQPMSVTETGTTWAVNTSATTSGVYLFRIVSKEGTIVAPFVVAR